MAKLFQPTGTGRAVRAKKAHDRRVAGMRLGRGPLGAVLLPIRPLPRPGTKGRIGATIGTLMSPMGSVIVRGQGRGLRPPGSTAILSAGHGDHALGSVLLRGQGQGVHPFTQMQSQGVGLHELVGLGDVSTDPGDCAAAWAIYNTLGVGDQPACPDPGAGSQTGQTLYSGDGQVAQRIQAYYDTINTTWPSNLALFPPAQTIPMVQSALSYAAGAIAQLQAGIQRYSGSGGYADTFQSVLNSLTKFTGKLQQDLGTLQAAGAASSPTVQLANLRDDILGTLENSKLGLNALDYASINDMWSFLPDQLYQLLDGVMAALQALLNFIGKAPQYFSDLLTWVKWGLIGGIAFFVASSLQKTRGSATGSSK